MLAIRSDGAKVETSPLTVGFASKLAPTGQFFGVELVLIPSKLTLVNGYGAGFVVHHTSASLILCENADPTVRRDLETFMARLIPDGAAWLEHNDEGPDDMPAHIRTVLTQSSLTLPLSERRCALGTWQGIYLWEHRRSPHRRQVTVTVQGT